MDRLRLCLLNTSYEPDETRRNFRRELDADLTEYHTPEGELPPPELAGAFEAFDGCVVTGSRASVYWDEEWIADLRGWVSDAIEDGMPFLGVCFGHQFLADVLGGTVSDMGEYEIGYQSVSQCDQSRLFAGLDRTFTAFETHSDRVTALPDEATRIAENEYGIQGFRHGRIFGVQFHPEYDQQTARRVTREKEQLSQQQIQRVLDGITDERYARACKTKQLFENFTGFVRQQRDAVGVQPTR